MTYAEVVVEPASRRVRAAVGPKRGNAVFGGEVVVKFSTGASMDVRATAEKAVLFQSCNNVRRKRCVVVESEKLRGHVPESHSRSRRWQKPRRGRQKRLSQCGITSQGCVSLAEALKLNPSHLQELNLSWNYLRDEGVEILSKGLSSPHCILKVLELSQCEITDKGCISLAKALKLNPSHLQELNIWDNRIEEKGKRVLLEIKEDPSYSLKTVEFKPWD
ncbi:ribonuclease inhibitor-like [Corythoichthys intestinalis]|uniref:ribonuclease inhibitor-like n=1 Tax=Corythoichthys intestinalis TaxID=161448 RepID=UPI0025A5F875|nr:ribonuclease inhibitor-like [Corythoichthys intestinalis]